MSSSSIPNRNGSLIPVQNTSAPQINIIQVLEDNHFKVECTIPRPADSDNNYAQLFRGTYKQTYQTVVGKVISLDNSATEYRLRHLARNQCAIKSLKHVALVEMFECKVLLANKLLLVMEHCAGGSLCDLLLARGPRAPLPESTARRYYRQFGDALRYMHAAGYAHRNVKCEKILLDASRTNCKLADFGLTRSCFRYGNSQQLLQLVADGDPSQANGGGSSNWC